MRIIYSKQANKFIKNQEEKNILRLKSAIENLPKGNTKKLKGFSPPLYRLSVGNFRVIYSYVNSIISVLKIDSRGQVYK